MASCEIGEITADLLGSESVMLTRSNHAMNFEVTPEQQTLQKAAIEFARQELNSNMIERDAQQVFSHDGWKKCAAFGVQGMPIPKEYGGRNADAITSIPLLKYGIAEQKKKYLPGLCDGSLIGANGASEPNAGSDIFSMQTRVA